MGCGVHSRAATKWGAASIRINAVVESDMETISQASLHEHSKHLVWVLVQIA